jgi:hypothetical protein
MPTRHVLTFALWSLIACGGAEPDGETDTGEETVDDGDPDISNVVPSDYPPEAPINLLIFGDSISTGVGSEAGNSYFNLLQENDGAAYPNHEDFDFESAFPTVTNVVSVAESGAQTGDLAGQIAAAEDALGVPSGPTLVIGTIGGNDLVSIMFGQDRETVADRMASNIEALVDWVQDPAQFPDGGYLYIANVYDPSDGVGQADGCFVGIPTTEAVLGLQDANSRTRAMAEERGFAMVDMHGHFMGHGHNFDDSSIEAYDAADPTLWFASDCIHPNQRGHHELRRVFFGAIANEPVPYEEAP